MVYSDFKAYGVRWILYDENSLVVGKYEKTYTIPMNLQQIQEIEQDFKKLSDDELKNISISFYIWCTDPYGSDTSPFMDWFSGSAMALNRIFLEGDNLILW